MKNLLLTIIIISAGLVTGFSQTGTIRGTVFDGETGETIPFATVLLASDPGVGTTTDLDGVYELSVPAGSQDIKFSYLGYAEQTISGVAVEADKVVLLDAKIQEAAEMLTEVVITATQARNTESAILTLQRKSPNVIDGVSSESFRKIGDGDAASAIKRVTGVSIEDGKHVYVRGLGDRYTKTILNGLDIPGLDPDRNSIQMDIFPTNLIDNIIVLKSFTPDQPGDFTGGLVNIITKDFPESQTFNVSASLGYNPKMNLNNEFVTYEGSSTDKLGFDNGARDEPININDYIPDPSERNPDLTNITNKFGKTMSTQRSSKFLNQSYGISYGNQNKVGSGSIGYNASINYKTDFTFYDDVEYGTYIKESNKSNNELYVDRSIRGGQSEENVLISGMAGLAYKSKNHKIGVNALAIQNGSANTALLEQIVYETNPSTLLKSNLEYTERSIQNLLVFGKHSFNEGDFEVDWRVSPTHSKITEPDNRVTAFEVVNQGEQISYELNASVGAGITRVWRNLEENNISGKIGATWKFNQWNDLESKFKFGAMYTQKKRDYSISNYLFRVEQAGQFDITGDPNQLFSNEFSWDPSARAGTYVRGNFEPANTFDAEQVVIAGYVMNELPLSNRLRTIYGLRVEQSANFYTGQNNLGDEVYDNAKVLDEFDLLPSLNIVYALSEKINIRTSYNRTLARPSFKEKSVAQIQDLISGRTFIGNIDLEETQINNFDVRFENFYDFGQVLSISGFFKQFNNPIELVAYSEATPNDVQPRNIDEATVFGLELEARKNFNFGSENFNKLTIGSNVSLIKSNVDMSDAEYQSRLDNARDGEDISSSRELVGQSPYLLNLFLGFQSAENIVESNLSYNVQGKSLSIVGIGRNADVFDLPFHSLNFKTSVKLGLQKRMRASFSVNNILNQSRQRVYQSFEAADQVFEKYKPGTDFQVGLSYSF
ncbi:TonB-dependent receptor [Membranihabitans marinus]|uniref:TonB-dependent receptor n=1 Tax=Membranihabitans marinus TaxID=1227546 RepID=UPI001F1CF48F|nr:TonB-dependent receptor [Membranihabitans marinus]